jgi:hypothetical protein
MIANLHFFEEIDAEKSGIMATKRGNSKSIATSIATSSASCSPFLLPFSLFGIVFVTCCLIKL